MNHRETTLPEFSVVDAASADAQFAMRRYVEELLGRLPHGFTVEEALATAEVAYNPPAGQRGRIEVRVVSR